MAHVFFLSSLEMHAGLAAKSNHELNPTYHNTTKHAHPSLPKIGILSLSGLALAIFCIAALPFYLLNFSAPSATLSHDFTCTIAAICGLLLPVPIVWLLDFRYTASHWDFLGPCRHCLADTTDPARSGHFVRYIRNAQSSNALVAAGLYELAMVSSSTKHTRAWLASILVGGSLLALGLASYVWWSSEREYACRGDNFLMEAHFLLIAVLFISVAIPVIETSLCGLAVAMIALRWMQVRRAPTLIPAALVEVVLLVYIAAFGASVTLGMGDIWWAVVAASSLLLGVIFKVADVNGLLICGTAVFHFFSALGMIALFMWAQTMPAPGR